MFVHFTLLELESDGLYVLKIVFVPYVPLSQNRPNGVALPVYQSEVDSLYWVEKNV